LPDSNFHEAAFEGDLVELASTKSNSFVFIIERGAVQQTHRGVVSHDDLIGKKWGSEIYSHQGSQFYLFQPGIFSIHSTTKRNTQIMYPKDIGFIIIKMNIGPGCKLIEAGTGSGGLTQVLAYLVGEAGHVYSYEIRKEMQDLAKKNLNRLGLLDRVTFYNLDIQEGFLEKNIDAIFLDVPNPYDYLLQTRDALKPGGYFGCLLPTSNQVIKTLIALRRNDFDFTDVCETFLRYYQAEENKFRPTDRMVAHTGYLVFSRHILPQVLELPQQDE